MKSDYGILQNVMRLEIKFRCYIFYISTGNLCDQNIDLSANARMKRRFILNLILFYYCYLKKEWKLHFWNYIHLKQKEAECYHEFSYQNSIKWIYDSNEDPDQDEINLILKVSLPTISYSLCVLLFYVLCVFSFLFF